MICFGNECEAVSQFCVDIIYSRNKRLLLRNVFVLIFSSVKLYFGHSGPNISRLTVSNCYNYCYHDGTKSMKNTYKNYI